MKELKDRTVFKISLYEDCGGFYIETNEYESDDSVGDDYFFISDKRVYDAIIKDIRNVITHWRNNDCKHL